MIEWEELPMKTDIRRRERLSVDVLPQQHRQIKAYAAFHGMTIRQYILESVQERLRQESETKMLSDLSGHLEQDPILRELWNNEKDTEYDRL